MSAVSLTHYHAVLHKMSLLYCCQERETINPICPFLDADLIWPLLQPSAAVMLDIVVAKPLAEAVHHTPAE